MQTHLPISAENWLFRLRAVPETQSCRFISRNCTRSTHVSLAHISSTPQHVLQSVPVRWSHALLCLGVAVVLDPLLTLVVDLADQHWAGDAFKLYNYFMQLVCVQSAVIEGVRWNRSRTTKHMQDSLSWFHLNCANASATIVSESQPW